MHTMYSAIIRTAFVSFVLVRLLGGGITPAAAQVLPPIITPSPGSTLTTTTVTFTGVHASQAGEQHYLSVGSGKGAFDNNIYHQSLGTGHTATVSGLPTSGTLHVLYWTKTNAASWAFRSHTYTMAVGSSGGGSGGGAAAHADLASDHANLDIDHDGLDQKLDQMLADINNLLMGAPCGQGTEGQRFVLQSGGTEVCDNITGVRWQQTPGVPGTTPSNCDNGNDCVWQDAVDYCAALGSRLPEIKELISLVDYSVAFPGPVLPAGHPFDAVFPIGTKNADYHSATPLANNPAKEFVVNFDFGTVDQISKDDNNHTWCVR